MLFEEALFIYLSTYTSLTSYLDTRIFPLIVPDEQTIPAIVYQQISSRIIDSLQESSGAGYYNYQITAYAETYSIAKNIANVIKTALKDYKGIMGGIDGVNVQTTHKIGDDIDRYDEEFKEYSVMQEYSFFITK